MCMCLMFKSACSEQDSEPGARLTCRILLHLFKTPQRNPVPQDGVKSGSEHTYETSNHIVCVDHFVMCNVLCCGLCRQVLRWYPVVLWSPPSCGFSEQHRCRSSVCCPQSSVHAGYEFRSYISSSWYESIRLHWIGCAQISLKVSGSFMFAVGDAELRGSGLSHPAGLDDISEGRNVSIETASLDVYAKYVLKTICQQVRTGNGVNMFEKR